MPNTEVTFAHPETGEKVTLSIPPQDLTYVHHDESVPGELVNAVLKGDYDSMCDVYEWEMDAYSESHYLRQCDARDELLKPHGLEPWDLDDGDEQSILEAIREAEESDPLSQLIKNTTALFMLYPLADGVELSQSEVADVCNAHGVIVDAAEASEAESQATMYGHHEGVMLYVAVTANLNEARWTPGVLGWEVVDPILILWDSWNGTGMEFDSKGTLRVDADHKLGKFWQLDDSSRGPDEACGYNHGAFRRAIEGRR